jgi:hypothetical protein
MTSAASARFASVSAEQIEKMVQDKDSENLKILNNKIIYIEFGLRIRIIQTSVSVICFSFASADNTARPRSE